MNSCISNATLKLHHWFTKNKICKPKDVIKIFRLSWNDKTFGVSINNHITGYGTLCPISERLENFRFKRKK